MASLNAPTVRTSDLNGFHTFHQVVPIDDASRLSVKLVKNGTLKVYPGYPHGMLTIHADVINPDLLAFIKA
jgi:non-heme chloroperoxidase